MYKILVLGYSRDDLSFIQKINLLCKILSRKSVSLGLEQDNTDAELSEKIEWYEAQIQQTKQLAHSLFNLSFEELISPQNNKKGSKVLASRIKMFLYQKTIIQACLANNIGFYEAGAKPDIDRIVDNISPYPTKHHVFLYEKDHLFHLKNDLRSPETVVDAIFFASSNYFISNEIQDTLKNTHTHFCLLPETNFSQKIEQIIEQAMRYLDEKVGLSVSVKANQKEKYFRMHGG